MATSRDQMQIQISAQDQTQAAFNTLKASMRSVQQQLDQLRKSLSGTQVNELKNVVAGFGDLEKAQDRASSAGANLANTLTRRLILGYLVTQAKGAAAAIFNLNHELANVGDTAGRTGIGSGLLQGLQAAGAYKGVNGNEFLESMIKLNEQVTQAKSGLGSLNMLFRANGVSATTTQDAFMKVADLVKNAANEADKFSIVQQAGLPATREMVKLLEQGSAALAKQATAVDVITENQIKAAQKVDEDFNKLWENFKRTGRKAVVETFDTSTWSINIIPGSPVDKLMKLFEGVNRGLTGAPPPPLPSATLTAPDLNLGEGGAPASARFIPKPTVNPAEELKKIALQQQSLSLLGQLTTATEARRQVELQLQAASLNQIPIDAKRAELLKQLAYERALGIDQIKSQKDAYDVEAATIGMTVGAAEAYRVVQTKINEQRRLGVELTSEEIAKLREQAAALGAAADQTANLRFGNEVFRGLFADVVSGIRSGANAFDALEKAAMNALNKITDKLVQMAADQVWKSAFGGTGGGGGTSIFGSLFGGAGPGPTAYSGTGNPWAAGGMVAVAHSGWVVGAGAPPASRYVNPSVFAGARRMHRGGIAGDEVPTILQKGERVIPRGASSGNNVVVNIHNAPAGTEVQRKPGPGGFDIIDVVLGKVKSEIGSGGMDDVMSRFGNSPRAVSR